MSWTIPKMWEGGECWIIGGGPSIPQQFAIPEEVVKDVYSGRQPLSAYSPYLSPIHGKHVIGINAAFLLGKWIDIVFFGDPGFYTKNKHELAQFPKLKVSCAMELEGRKDVAQVKLLPKNMKHDYGITDSGNKVSWNLNSGAAAISLAVQLGVKKIYLLGFDMQLSEGGDKHWHKHYGKIKGNSASTFARHLRSFPSIAKDAERMKIEVINVSPESQINEFPKMSLKEVLR